MKLIQVSRLNNLFIKNAFDIYYVYNIRLILKIEEKTTYEEKVSIVLVGINGYGALYLKELLDGIEGAYIEGVVDIAPEKSDFYHFLVEKNIPIYESRRTFIQNQKQI